MPPENPTRRALLTTGAAVAMEAGALTLSGAAVACSPASDAAAGAAGAGTAPLNVRDFGAVGDAQHHPLSERFASLTDARRTFPFATSLEQTLDWAGIQAAVNAVAGRANRRVYLPAGRYRISNSIRLPNIIDFFGDTSGLTVIDNEVATLREPQLVNAEASFVGVSIRLMALNGGTHALKVSVPNGEIAWLTMEGVSCALQSDKNVECDRLLQSSEFRNCGFSLAPYGVFVADRTTNAVTFRNCSFEQHARAHLHLRSAEAVTFYGGKFEGGGALPNPSGEERATISLEDAGAVNFHGVYFESTHEILLKDMRSRSGVSFDGCHFTGADTGKGPIPYRFVSDGLVTFGTNDWYQSSEGPARMLVTGYNGQKLAPAGTGVELLSRSPRQQRSHSATRAVPTSGVLALALVKRVGAAGALPLLLTAELVLHGTVQPRAGGSALVSRRYHLRLAATPGAALAGRIEAVSTLDDPGVDLAINLRSQDQTGVVEAVLRGAAGATLQWSLDSLSTITADGTRLEAEVPAGP